MTSSIRLKSKVSSAESVKDRLITVGLILGLFIALLLLVWSLYYIHSVVMIELEYNESQARYVVLYLLIGIYALNWILQPFFKSILKKLKLEVPNSSHE